MEEEPQAATNSGTLPSVTEQHYMQKLFGRPLCVYCPGALYYIRKGLVTVTDETRALKHAKTDRIRQKERLASVIQQKLESL